MNFLHNSLGYLNTWLSPKAAPEPGNHKFGTFDGVFLPTLLTILGAVMYLRTGWVMGNAGLVGGLLIISLANLITICTGLSISSVATNIRVGAGGSFSIISQSLGLEVGGSVNLPFSQERAWLQQNGHLQLPVPMLSVSEQTVGNLAAIAVDNRAGGRLATEHLVEQGYQHIGLITGSRVITMICPNFCLAVYCRYRSWER